MNVQSLSHVYRKYERQKFERRVSKYYPEQCFYLTDRNICHYLMERMIDLQRMIDKKKHVFVYSVEFVQFYPAQILFAAPFKIVPYGTKFFKIVTNHPHSLSVGQ